MSRSKFEDDDTTATGDIIIFKGTQGAKLKPFVPT